MSASRKAGGSRGRGRRICGCATRYEMKLSRRTCEADFRHVRDSRLGHLYVLRSFLVADVDLRAFSPRRSDSEGEGRCRHGASAVTFLEIGKPRWVHIPMCMKRARIANEESETILAVALRQGSGNGLSQRRAGQRARNCGRGGPCSRRRGFSRRRLPFLCARGLASERLWLGTHLNLCRWSARSFLRAGRCRTRLPFRSGGVFLATLFRHTSNAMRSPPQVPCLYSHAPPSHECSRSSVSFALRTV